MKRLFILFLLAISAAACANLSSLVAFAGLHAPRVVIASFDSDGAPTKAALEPLVREVTGQFGHPTLCLEPKQPKARLVCLQIAAEHPSDVFVFDASKLTHHSYGDISAPDSHPDLALASGLSPPQQIHSQPFAQQEPFAYTYNLRQGLQRWRDALGRIRDVQPAGSTSQYGVDVLVVGDSTGTYANIYESWPHFLKVMLQEKYNKSGVVGGFGFMPFQTQNSTSNDWTALNYYTVTCTSANATQGATYTNGGHTFYVPATIAGSTTLTLNGTVAPAASGTLTKASGTGDATITYSSFVTTNSWTITYNNTNSNAVAGLTQYQTGSASVGCKICRYFDPTTAAGVFQRQGITDWEYVGTSGFGSPNYNTAFLDSSTSSGPIFPPSHSVTDNSSIYGQHWADQSGLTGTVAHEIQIATTSADKVCGGGMIFYNGDYNEGVRLHNLSSVGSDAPNWYQSGGANHYQANYDNWCTGANGGARNCKLIIVNEMINSCGATSADISAATWQADWQAVVTHCVALTSRPCFLFIVNRPWDLTVSNPTQLALYKSFRTAAYALAAANPQTVAVADRWMDLCDDANTYQFVLSGVSTAPTAGATYTNNGVTFTCVGTNAGKTGTAMTGSGSPAASGTLVKTAGTGDANITFTSFIPPATGGLANYGINAAGGAMFNRGWYNDGTHNLGVGNMAEGRWMFGIVSWGNGSDPVWCGIVGLIALGRIRRSLRRRIRNNYAFSA